MSNGLGDESAAYGSHLRRVNARRLNFASWYLAVVLTLLLAINLGLPELHLFTHAYVNLVSLLYFLGLGSVIRSPRVLSWPTAALPLLFGIGATATGIQFSIDLTRNLGANPAYSTLIFVACLAPLWLPRLLLAMLIPAHLIYLATVFDRVHSTIFILVMAIGGTAAAALGALTALLASRAERRSFDAAAAIRRQKDELAVALARVESLLSGRREMVAMVAHDLQSPLAGIRALLQTMSGAPPSDARKLDAISRSCSQMHRAIDGLIAAHAAEAAAEPVLASVEVETLFGRAEAAAEAVAAAKGIAIERAAGGCRVRTDPVVVGGMLDNLLSNAIKFSPARSAVRLEATQTEAGVRLRVRDNGPGIPAMDVPLLFKKFARLTAQPTGAEPSTGLGLYIVRMQAERIGAQVGYAPNPEGGSIFFIDLPASPAAAVFSSVPAESDAPPLGALSVRS